MTKTLAINDEDHSRLLSMVRKRSAAMDDKIYIHEFMGDLLDAYEELNEYHRDCLRRN